ncbi:MAG: hypothetical protein IT426_03780 [Pirellulales bacterium]|nr:hypothetical protein [Pirellulales bacterium]
MSPRFAAAAEESGDFSPQIATAAPNSGNAPLEQVIVVFKTHYDIGYTDLAKNVVQLFRTAMIDRACDLVEANRNRPAEEPFVWTVPGWPMKKILEGWEGQTPERQRRVRQALAEDRFVIHALPFTTHTESLEIEDLVRGMEYSSRLSRALGKELPRDAKMTDVPCHTWFLATMLKHAGVDFLHVGGNWVCHPPEAPLLFWWEGPDGSRVLTMHTAEYGSSLTPPENWPHKTWLALVQYNDNEVPPAAEEIQKTFAEIKRRLPGVKIRVGRLSDFSAAILAEKPALPVVRGDMPDTWIHGPLSDPQGVALSRRIRPQIEALESLATQLKCWGVANIDSRAALDAIRENSLLYGEHTWGGAIRWIGKKLSYGEKWEKRREKGEFRRIEASWDEHSAYIHDAARALTDFRAERLSDLAKAVRYSGKRIVVYNPLPWKRSAVVCVKADDSSAIPSAVKSADGEHPVFVERCPGGFQFMAQDVPPMGYRTFVPATEKSAGSPLPQKTAELESPFFRVSLEPARGCIRSLIDKRNGREWVDAASPYGFGQLLHERFDADQVKAFVEAYLTAKNTQKNQFGKNDLPPAAEAPYQALGLKDCTVSTTQSRHETAAVLSGRVEGRGVSYKGRMRIALHKDRPEATITVFVDDKPADPWPEALWICLPLTIDAPQFRLGRVGSIIDPAKDVVPGSNRHLYMLNTGLTVTDSQSRGVGICPLDHPLVSLDTPGCWKYSLDFTPKKSWAFVNFFNNQWSTNFRLWNGGSWSSSVRLWAIENGDPQENLIVPSLEARQPLMAAMDDGPGGKLPPSQAGLELSNRGAQVTTFGPNPDGEGIVLRLWELAGRNGECQVMLPVGMNAAAMQPVDLRGRPSGNPLPVSDRRFTIPLRAFAPASFVILSPKDPTR